MTTAVYAGVQALLTDTSVSSLVANRIYPVVAPQEMQQLHAVVSQIIAVDEMIQDGPSGLVLSRITIEARGRSATATINLGTAIIAALQPIHLQTFAGLICSFRKEGTDVTEYSDNSGFHRRIIDFYVRHRIA